MERKVFTDVQMVEMLKRLYREHNCRYELRLGVNNNGKITYHLSYQVPRKKKDGSWSRRTWWISETNTSLYMLLALEALRLSSWMGWE